MSKASKKAAQAAATETPVINAPAVHEAPVTHEAPAEAAAPAVPAEPKVEGKIKQILDLHKAGKTNKEIVEMGFNKTTVSIQVARYKKKLEAESGAGTAAEATAPAAIAAEEAVIEESKS